MSSTHAHAKWAVVDGANARRMVLLALQLVDVAQKHVHMQMLQKTISKAIMMNNKYTHWRETFHAHTGEIHFMHILYWRETFCPHVGYTFRAHTGEKHSVDTPDKHIGWYLALTVCTQEKHTHNEKLNAL